MDEFRLSYTVFRQTVRILREILCSFSFIENSEKILSVDVCHSLPICLYSISQSVQSVCTVG